MKCQAQLQIKNHLLLSTIEQGCPFNTQTFKYWNTQYFIVAMWLSTCSRHPLSSIKLLNKQKHIRCTQIINEAIQLHTICSLAHNVNISSQCNTKFDESPMNSKKQKKINSGHVGHGKKWFRTILRIR